MLARGLSDKLGDCKSTLNPGPGSLKDLVRVGREIWRVFFNYTIGKKANTSYFQALQEIQHTTSCASPH